MLAVAFRFIYLWLHRRKRESETSEQLNGISHQTLFAKGYIVTGLPFTSCIGSTPSISHPDATLGGRLDNIHALFSDRRQYSSILALRRHAGGMTRRCLTTNRLTFTSNEPNHNANNGV